MTPKVPDYGHRYADKKLVTLLRRIRLSYRQASLSLQQKIDDYLKQFEKEDAMKRALYDSGELSHEDFLKWRRKAVLETQQWKDMREQLTNDLMNQDRIATDIINDALPEVYAENHNYGTYEAEVGSGIDTTYTMYDKNTVARLLRENQDLLPNYHKPDLDISKDKLWNRQHIQSAVLQGILTGEPMGDIAKRFQNVVGMDERAAMRNARTAVTGAENAGRIDSYLRAETMGIKMKQVWMATHDNRVRDSHAILDGEKQDPGEKFSNGCRYPGDPEGAPEEIYNCRCTLVAEVEGSDPYDPTARPSELLQNMSYDEWKQMHGEQFFTKLFKDYKEPEEEKWHIVQGQDISQTWQRRPDQFAFAIEDVINAQGFDGLPRVVSQTEFDEAVRKANNGNGFIAQRAYSAPDKETLDLYREELYKGKWYVDCSVGGASFGQGMYAIPSYDGKVTDEMKSGMDQYITRWGERPALIETMTLDESASIISLSEIKNMKQQLNITAMKEINDSGWDRAVARKWDAIIHNDDGVFATMLGYDAIKVDTKDLNSYPEIIILNRTKVIFLGK